VFSDEGRDKKFSAPAILLFFLSCPPNPLIVKYILSLFLFLFCLSIQAQIVEPLKDSVEKYEKQKRYKKVLPFAEQWAEKLKKDKKESSAEYGYALNSLGNALNRSGKSKEAEPILLQALEIRKKALGPEHPDVATSLNNLGILYENMGDYPKAAPYKLLALEIRRKALGPEHPDVAASLNNLGVLYDNMGDYAKAEPYYLQALEIRKKALGPEHPNVAQSHNNLGILYDVLGDYVKAEPYYLQALEIYKKALGPDHPDVAQSLNNLGVLYNNMGNYAKAEPYHQQALEISKKALGPEHMDVANSLNNLGLLYVNMSDYAKAETYFQQALEIWKKVLGPEHPDVAASLNNLGVLNKNMGDYAKAEPYYLLSLEIRKKALGPDHPDVAQSLNNLGVLYMNMGNYAKAEPFHLQDLEISKKALGPDHPDVGTALNGLGLFYHGMRNYTKADGFYLKWNANKQGQIQRYFPFLSDNEKAKFYYSKLSGYQANFLSFCVDRYPGQKTIAGPMYNDQLATKGLLLNSAAKWKHRIRNSQDTILKKQFNQWEILTNEIAKSFSSTDSAELVQVKTLQDEAEKLEKELIKKSEDFATLADKTIYTWKDVQSKLKPGEAAIEMVRVRKYGIAKVVTDTSDPKKPTYREKGLTDTVQYAALILTKTSQQPEMVILPNGNDLEGKWHKHYRKSIRLHQKDNQSYRQYWQPIGRKLKGIKKVWISADGIYHKINPGTLQNPASGKYLMDELEVGLLSSGKDLIISHRGERENRHAWLLGNPEFQPGQRSAPGEDIRSGPKLSYYLSPDPTMKVQALPGTQAEVDSVGNLLVNTGWKVEEYTGAEATEEKVKEINKPGVLLLSTHGYFRPDSTPGSNPLLRSGILLSGAAKTLREGRSGEGEDGILTAYEAMNLNLDNTELVVLSACETGLGEIKNGEGVYGLQRAFQVAGARNIIMSLWKVNDEVTQELMVAFFRNWLGDEAAVGTSGQTADRLAKGSDDLRLAFRKAQLEIRKKHPEPYYWGGFVMLGK
jgi:tetratricopeptide (TPR) repeat protein